MLVMSYSDMRKNFYEIMEKTANGEQICITRKGREPFIIAKVGASAGTLRKETKHEKRAQSINKLKGRHAATVRSLADK